MNSKLTCMFVLVILCIQAGVQLWGQGQSGSTWLVLEKLELVNSKAESVTYLGRKAIRVSDAEPQGDAERLAVVRGTSFQDGTIEVDLSGDTALNAPPELRGFVGIAFRVATDKSHSHFECFYLRPKNGRSENQLQRNHSAQYISIPGFDWQKLRTETPGKYESYVDLVPGQWTHIKIQVTGMRARLYVNRAEQPTLIVDDLKQPPASGAIALWVGPGTIAHFTDLIFSQ